MTTLTDLCNKVITDLTPEIKKTYTLYSGTDDVRGVVRAIYAAEVLARIVLMQQEALKAISLDYYNKYDGLSVFKRSDIEDTIEFDTRLAKDALAKAEEMAKELG